MACFFPEQLHQKRVSFVMRVFFSHGACKRNGEKSRQGDKGIFTTRNVPLKSVVNIVLVSFIFISLRTTGTPVHRPLVRLLVDVYRSSAMPTWLYILNRLCHTLSSVPSPFSLKNRLTPAYHPLDHTSSLRLNPRCQRGKKKHISMMLVCGDCAGFVPLWMPKRPYAPA